MAALVECNIRGGYGFVGSTISKGFLRQLATARMPYDMSAAGINRQDILDAVKIRIVGNRLPDAQSVANALEVDSAHGLFEHRIEAGAIARPGKGTRQFITANGIQIDYVSAPDIKAIPWTEEGAVRVMIDASGKIKNSPDDVRPALRRFGNLSGADIIIATTTLKGAENHVIGTPLEDRVNPLMQDFINGVDLGVRLAFGCGSCTTNVTLATVIALAPYMTFDELVNLITVHAVTGSQKLVDVPDASAVERGRAAFASIIPTSTNAKELGNVYPGLFGKINEALAYRIPTLEGSIVDLLIKATPKEGHAIYTPGEINDILMNASATAQLNGVLGIVPEGKTRVSTDFVNDRHSAIADLNLTKTAPWYNDDGSINPRHFKLYLRSFYANGFAEPHRNLEMFMRLVMNLILAQRNGQTVQTIQGYPA